MPLMKNLPSVELLHQILVCDAEAGQLFWKVRPSSFFSCERLANAWNAKNAGKLAFTANSKSGYKVGSVLKGDAYAHRVIFKMVHGFEPKQIDHINHDRADNRIANLRAVDDAGNGRNRSLLKRNTSGVLGVVFDRSRKKWKAQIGVNGTTKLLGRFETLEEAAAARKQADAFYGFHENHGSNNRYKLVLPA